MRDELIAAHYLCCHLLGRWHFIFQPCWVHVVGARLFFLLFVMFAFTATADLIECEPKLEEPVVMIKGLSVEKKNWPPDTLEKLVFRTSADKGVELDETSPNFDENKSFVSQQNWQFSHNQYFGEGILEVDGNNASINSVLSKTQFLFSASLETENGREIVVGEMTCRNME